MQRNEQHKYYIILNKMGYTKGINWFYILQSKQSDGMEWFLGALYFIVLLTNLYI